MGTLKHSFTIPRISSRELLLLEYCGSFGVVGGLGGTCSSFDLSSWEMRRLGGSRPSTHLSSSQLTLWLLKKLEIEAEIQGQDCGWFGVAVSKGASRENHDSP